MADVSAYPEIVSSGPQLMHRARIAAIDGQRFILSETQKVRRFEGFNHDVPGDAHLSVQNTSGF